MSKLNPGQQIDEYIAQFDIPIQEILHRTRAVIQETAPKAIEKFSYQMPTFYLKGNLVYFAAAKKHLGFYPMPSGIATFATELSPYKTSKGAAQFPYSQPIPYDLIKEIVAFRVAENLTK